MRTTKETGAHKYCKLFLIYSESKITRYQNQTSQRITARPYTRIFRQKGTFLLKHRGKANTKTKLLVKSKDKKFWELNERVWKLENDIKPLITTPAVPVLKPTRQRNDRNGCSQLPIKKSTTGAKGRHRELQQVTIPPWISVHAQEPQL